MKPVLTEKKDDGPPLVVYARFAIRMLRFIDLFTINTTILLSVNILIAVYFSHLPVFSYKNLRLCKESLILLESYQKKKLGSLRPHQRI